MRMKASAYKQYGDAAILSLVLESLPQIAAEVSAPLAKTEEIVLIGKWALSIVWDVQLKLLPPCSLVLRNAVDMLFLMGF